MKRPVFLLVSPRKTILPFLFLATALVLAVMRPATAGPKAESGTAIGVEVDRAQLIQLPEAATNVFVANPDIADIQVPTPTTFFVLGKKAGSTTAYAITADGKMLSYTVTVRRQAGGLLGALRKEAPGADIQVTGTPNGIVVSGTVNTPKDALRLKDVAHDFLGEKENLIFNVGVRESTQVNLQVRVAEVARSTDKQFGFNWDAIYNNGTVAVGLITGRTPITAAFGKFIPSTATTNPPNSLGFGYRSKGGAVNISGMIDALATEGLVTVLAEPNLTAVSGETAKFLAGGEFPIPVAQGLGQISIEFRRFGISVDFTPTVLDPNRLSIKVRPEVSELSDQGAIVIDSISIPSLKVRRAETTVELASGQSFAIAGLFQNNVATSVSRYPWLGDVPILGALFRSSSFQRNETELVIIVTPFIVRPVANPSDLHLPTEGLEFSSDLDRVLSGRLTATSGQRPEPPSSDQTPHLHGAAGFMLETQQ